MHVGSCRRLTVKNRSSKEHQELDEHVLFLGTQLVPAEAFPPVFNIAVRDTLFDVRVEPLVWYCTILLRDLFLLAPEL